MERPGGAGGKDTCPRRQRLPDDAGAVRLARGSAVAPHIRLRHSTRSEGDDTLRARREAWTLRRKAAPISASVAALAGGAVVATGFVGTAARWRQLTANSGVGVPTPSERR